MLITLLLDSSLALQGISDDDAPIAMKNVEIESIGEDAVLIVTKRGRVFIVQTDPELKILATYKATLQPEVRLVFLASILSTTS